MENSTVISRIDYIMAPVGWIDVICKSKIKSFNNNLSPDYNLIYISMYIAIKRRPVKAKQPVTDLTRKFGRSTVLKIILPGDDTEGKKKVKDLVNIMSDVLNEEVYVKARTNGSVPKKDMDTVFNKFMQDLHNSIAKALGTRHVKMGVVVRNFEEDDTARCWNKIISVLTKVLITLSP